MKCDSCDGTGKVPRFRNGTQYDHVTCPRCVRGMTQQTGDRPNGN